MSEYFANFPRIPYDINGTNLTSEMQDELTNINDEIAAQKREVAQEVDNKVPKSYLKLTAPGGGR